MLAMLRHRQDSQYVITLTADICEIDCASSTVAGFISLSRSSKCVPNASKACSQATDDNATQLCGTPKTPDGFCKTTAQSAICQYPDGTTFPCADPPTSISTASTSATTQSSSSTTAGLFPLISSTAAPGASMPATVPTTISTTPQSATSLASTTAAAATQSGSNSALAKTSHKSSGIGSGAAAGLAIGCLIAGAAIAALAFFFLFRRYKKRQEQQDSAGYMHHLGPYNGAVAPAVAEKALPVATTQAVSPIDTLLPQPAEDDAIIGELSRLRDKIKNHAQTFYHTAAVDPVMVDESELLDVARATGIRSMALCDMLLNPQTRIVTIRLFISYVILSRCGGQGGAGASLLPPEVGMFADALAGIDGTNAGQLALKSKWQSISATLLASRYGSSTFSDSDARSHSIAAAITVIDGVLRPFVSPHQDDAQRLRNLQSVLQRAAAFAFLLFSQPSTFRFQWSAHGKLAVFPALLQTSDESALVLNPPHVFVDLEVA